MGREPVVEVFADAAIRLEIPKTAGEALPNAVMETLAGIPIVRAVQLEEVGTVTPSNDVLEVACAVQFTFHLDPQRVRDNPIQRIRGELADSKSVDEVMWFDPIDGPYRIESW